MRRRRKRLVANVAALVVAMSAYAFPAESAAAPASQCVGQCVISCPGITACDFCGGYWNCNPYGNCPYPYFTFSCLL
jgi:hypothetical protein